MTEKRRVSLGRLRAAAAAGGPLSIEALAKHDATMAELREHEVEKHVNDVTIAGAGAGTRISGPLMPHRDDEVVVWLREQRKQYEGSPSFASGYNAIDALLDDYKLRADLGKSLSDDLTGEPF